MENAVRTRVMGALASPHRLAMLWLMEERGEISVQALCAEFPHLTQSAVSQHLRKLRHAEIVLTRKERQLVFYRLADWDQVRMILQIARGLK